MTTTDHDPLAGYDTFGIDLSGATAAHRASFNRDTVRPTTCPTCDSSDPDDRPHLWSNGHLPCADLWHDAR